MAPLNSRSGCYDNPILQMRKLKVRERKEAVQGHSSNSMVEVGSELGLATAKAQVLTTTPLCPPVSWKQSLGLCFSQSYTHLSAFSLG